MVGASLTWAARDPGTSGDVPGNRVAAGAHAATGRCDVCGATIRFYWIVLCDACLGVALSDLLRPRE